MSESVLMYSLPNGTHVLVHQNVLETTGAENVPLVLVEDGSTTAASEEAGNLLTNMHIANTVTLEGSVETFLEGEHEEGVFESSENHTQQTSSETESTEFEGLDDFAEVVTWYKCRKCSYAVAQLPELVEHLKVHNITAKWKSNSIQINNLNSGNSENLRDEIPKKATSDDNGLRGEASECLIYLCGQCSQAYNSLEECKEHMMQDHNLVVQEGSELSTEESASDEDTTSKSYQNTAVLQLTRAKEVLQSIKKKQCNFVCTRAGCRHKFPTTEALNIHIKCHMADSCDNGIQQRFQCTECKVVFSGWKGCAMHLWVTHKLDAGLLLCCPICKKYRSAAISRMVAHMQTHGETRSFHCPDCGKSFKQSAQLRNHKVVHMNRKTDGLPRWYATKQCNICLKTYADAKCLKNHIQDVHSKLRPYVCHVCGHAAARRAMLQMHLRQHTGEKPHACPMCTYRTGDHNSLRRHIMRHTGQRPYRCPHCPYTAIQSNPYKNHLSLKHPGKSGIFSCIHCPFRTVNQEGFLLHVANHKNGVLPLSDSTNEYEISSNKNKSLPS